MWLSLICTKLNSPAFTEDWSSSERLLRLYDFSTPPCITHSAPVPAHAMHFRNPRRSIPSWLWSCTISSFILVAMCPPQSVHLVSASTLLTERREVRVYAWVPAPPWDVF